MKIRLILFIFLLSISGASHADKDLPAVPIILGQIDACYDEIKKTIENTYSEEQMEMFEFWDKKLLEIGQKLDLYQINSKTNELTWNEKSQHFDAYVKAYDDTLEEKSNDQLGVTCGWLKIVPMVYFIIGYDYGSNGNVGSLPKT